MDNPDFQHERKMMVEQQLRSRGVTDKEVLSAMLNVPRDAFVPDELKNSAYDDCPLPIGAGQTISQPYMVAAMTEYLEVEKKHRVLEIGTGSGYQTAILAELADTVYTVERLGELQNRARDILDKLGYDNVKYLVADGTLGWREESPFGRIIVTAGAPRVPEPLKDQLKENGIIIIPVGGEFSQDLTRVVRKKGAFKETCLMGCIFVRLLGEEGW